MNAEIIAVGSEMLTPARLDTNSLYLTGQLNQLGVEVVCKFVVGDDRDRLASLIRSSLSRSEILILSGGLGPTEDDVTRDAVAMAIGRNQKFHSEIADELQERFRRMGRKMAEVNKRQAFVIEGADILSNDRGSAPGQWIEDSGRYVLLLPGPPFELQAMFERHCLPRLARTVPHQLIETFEMRIAGMGESDVDQLIAPIYRKYSNPVTTILAKAGDIQVHLRARCGTKAEALSLLSEVAGPIEALLGDRIYSRNGDSLEVVVGEKLRQQKASVAIAESLTGGMLAERITSVPGSSDYFLGGFVTYTSEMKTDILGVSPDVIGSYGAVSAEVAEAMAVGARRRAGSTYAVATTGVAGPGTGGEQAHVGTVFLAVSSDSGCQVMHRQFPGDRQRVRQLATQYALDLLRRRLDLLIA